MAAMTEGLKARFSGKTLLVSVTALIGFIPMPGGALFSAPLVEACDTEHRLSNDTKTRINYWFRHMWEYWFPLYAGVIMALQITGLEIWQMTLANEKAVYACINYGEAFCPGEIENRSICVESDIGEVLKAVKSL